VIPRTFPPAPGWSPDGRRTKSEVDYGRGPEKTWVYGALRVRDGHEVTMTASSRDSAYYQQFLQKVEAADPTGDIYTTSSPTTLVSDGVVLLADGSSVFVEIGRTLSYARPVAKLERYDAYRTAPASDAATPPGPRAATGRRPTPGRCWAGPSRRCCSSSLPPRAAPATREAVFHQRAQHVYCVNYRIIVATTTLGQLTKRGPDEPVWRVAGRGAGEDR
jgi:hypothetical protein